MITAKPHSQSRPKPPPRLASLPQSAAPTLHPLQVPGPRTSIILSLPSLLCLPTNELVLSCPPSRSPRSKRPRQLSTPARRSSAPLLDRQQPPSALPASPLASPPSTVSSASRAMAVHVSPLLQTPSGSPPTETESASPFRTPKDSPTPGLGWHNHFRPPAFLLSLRSNLAGLPAAPDSRACPFGLPSAWSHVLRLPGGLRFSAAVSFLCGFDVVHGIHAAFPVCIC